MWPWEHAAVGYLLYSLGRRALGRRPPGDGEALVLLGATQFPDLVDKLLSWRFAVFPSGYAAGHSALVAVPVGVLALGAAIRRDRPALGAAFVVGYWSHPVADVLSPLRGGGSPDPGRVLWPLVEQQPYDTDYGLRRGLVYFERFLADLAAMEATTLLALYLLVPLATALLWVLDDTPGLAFLTRRLDAVRRS
jgi:hypothetical protein